jgi:enoyl-CoA hydratase/carnithine racemase
MSASDLVLTELRSGVLILTLNRPDRLNAWTDELEDAYFAALDAAEADPDVRVVVLTGAGRGFCAGADMDLLQGIAGGEQGETNEHRRPRSRPHELRKPLIAAINGAAAGLGLVEALYCDIRFCAPTAKLTTAFVRRGLIAEYGIAWLLPRLVGTGHALDLLLSGRVVLGTEAHEIGLVDYLVDDPLAAAVDYATDLATHCSPASMEIIKGQVYAALGGGFRGAYQRSEREMYASFERPDVAEGVTSYVEKRDPAFPPLDPPRRG